MSTRIKGPDGGSIDGSSGTRSVERLRPTAVGNRESSAPASSATDSVAITPSARAMLVLQEAVGAVADVDTKRVAEIRLAIENQSYRVDAGRIADRLMKLDADLSAANPLRRF